MREWPAVEFWIRIDGKRCRLGFYCPARFGWKTIHGRRKASRLPKPRRCQVLGTVDKRTSAEKCVRGDPAGCCRIDRDRYLFRDEEWQTFWLPRRWRFMETDRGLSP